MHVSIDDFWKLATASELLTPAECAELGRAFSDLKGAAHQANARSLALWLVATGKLTRYQASLLAAGRAGPFVFGPFVVTDRIDSGRLARLFRAAYDGSQNVLLVFLSKMTDDPEQHQGLAELAEAAAAVKNPHVSRTYRVVRHRSQTFIVVEGLEGETLAELLARQKLAHAAACQLVFQVALGLVAMHAQNLVHGAVCPQNVWISSGQSAKVLQFPLVPPEEWLARHDPPLIDYLAPELTAGQQRATAAADIYGLGCVLFEMIAGRPVFPGGTQPQKLTRHRAEFPQRLDQLNPQIPEELADLVAEMLAKDPLLRCQTASHVVHLLAPFAAASERRVSYPPKLDPKGLTPGYGAWKAPDWQSPPQQARGAPPESRPAELPAEPPGFNPPGATEANPRDWPAADHPRPRGETPDAHQAPRPQWPVEPTHVVGAAAANLDTLQIPGTAFDAPLVVTDARTNSAVKLPTRRTSKATLMGVGAGLAVVAALILAVFVANRGGDADGAKPSGATHKANATVPLVEAPAEDSESPTPVEVDRTSPPAATAAPEVTEVDDDGQTLWTSPTAGRPLDAAYVPSGAQVIFVLRPAELQNTSEGTKLIDALGPGGKWVENLLRTVLGIEPADLEQLTVAFTADEALAPQATYVIRLARDIPQATLLAAWGNPAAAKHEARAYFQGAVYAYYLPASGGGRVVVVAPGAMMKQILQSDGRPLLRRGVERLLARSDAHRHLNVLFTPSYLLTDGKNLLAGHLAKLRGPIVEFLDERIDGVLVSAHLGEELFLEFRAQAPIDIQPLALLELMKKRWEHVPERLEAHVASLQPHPHGRLVINRFPRMVQLARDYTRGGVEDGQVVLRAYLPAGAAHNLLLGSELTLLESSGTVRARAAGAAPSAGVSATDALTKKISLSFPREPLDRCMELLSAELGIEIVILGADLQLDGITKNQSLNNVEERDQPADGVLRKILLLANPAGKLAYVIKPRDGGREAVFITTKSAAKKRGDPLPAGF